MEITIRGTPEEITALVRATQERHFGAGQAPWDVIKEAVLQATDDTGPK